MVFGLLLKISVWWWLVTILWVLIALALIFIVLIQKGRGGGLGAMFGGGAANSLLGTKTGDFLTWVTIGLVALFLVVGVLMAKFMRPMPSSAFAPAAPTAAQPQSAEQPTAAPTAPTAPAEQPAQQPTEAAPAAPEQPQPAAQQPAAAPQPAEQQPAPAAP